MHLQIKQWVQFSDIAVQFESKLTPQALMDAVKNHYVPDQQQEIDRLEIELNNLGYAREESS